MIFACLCIVVYAVIEAHAEKGEVHAQLMPEASPVSVEMLTN